MTVFTLAAAPVAALVWAVAIYSLIGWRHRGAGPPTDRRARHARPRPDHGPVGGAVVGAVPLPADLGHRRDAGGRVVRHRDPWSSNVTGQQWVWTFSYPQQGGIESDQLYLPVNRPVVFHVTSDDVIHSFWVVQMGIKVDANPGPGHQATVTPTGSGTFDVRCAELCGLLHADMETSVHVVDAQDFQSWLRSNGTGG